MQPIVERLKSARMDIADALESIEQGKDTGVSPAGQRLVEELWALEDSAWGSLLTSFEGDGLHGVLTRLRSSFSEMREHRDRVLSRLQKIHHRAFFDFSIGELVVELHFVKNEGESLEVRHDLDDTFRIGASVIESVADAMRNMDALSADAKRRCIGQAFKEDLKRAAKSMEEIERIFKLVSSP